MHNKIKRSQDHLHMERFSRKNLCMERDTGIVRPRSCTTTGPTYILLTVQRTMAGNCKLRVSMNGLPIARHISKDQAQTGNHQETTTSLIEDTT